MTRRTPTSGVTLIEMLVALSVFALIGVAGFNVLDTILRADRQTAGRLQTVANWDLALRLVEADLRRAQAGVSINETALTLQTAGHRISYSTSEAGLRRRVEQAGRPALDQLVLPARATARWRAVGPTGAGARAVELVLLPSGDPADALVRLVPLPPALPVPP